MITLGPNDYLPANFPVVYWCTGKRRYFYIKNHNYFNNFMVAIWTDFYGHKLATQIADYYENKANFEIDPLDNYGEPMGVDLQNDEDIVSDSTPFDDIVCRVDPLSYMIEPGDNQPADTNLYLFVSKRQPYKIEPYTVADLPTYKIDYFPKERTFHKQDSYFTAYIRAYNLAEAKAMFDKTKKSKKAKDYAKYAML